MTSTIDMRMLNTIFNQYLNDGKKEESFEDYLKRKGFVIERESDYQFDENIKKSKYIDLSQIVSNPKKYKSFISYIVAIDYITGKISNQKEIVKTIRSIAESASLNNSTLNLSESDSTEIYNHYLKNNTHKMKKMTPKRTFLLKKIGIPTIVTAIICAGIGGIIAASSLVAGAIPFLTDSLILNITSLAVLGALAGAIITPIVIITKNKLTKFYYAHKYGTKTDNLNRILNSDLSKLAAIENLNLPINELFKKFKKTEEKIRATEHSKNPFVRLANWAREKTNRNRLHEIINVLSETNTRIRLTEDSDSKSKLKAFQKYLVKQTKNLEVSRKYADILVKARSNNKKNISNLKSSHKDSLETLYIDALGRAKDEDSKIETEIVHDLHPKKPTEKTPITPVISDEQDFVKKYGHLTLEELQKQQASNSNPSNDGSNQIRITSGIIHGTKNRPRRTSGIIHGLKNKPEEEISESESKQKGFIEQYGDLPIEELNKRFKENPDLEQEETKKTKTPTPKKSDSVKKTSDSKKVDKDKKSADSTKSAKSVKSEETSKKTSHDTKEDTTTENIEKGTTTKKSTKTKKDVSDTGKTDSDKKTKKTTDTNITSEDKKSTESEKTKKSNVKTSQDSEEDKLIREIDEKIKAEATETIQNEQTAQNNANSDKNSPSTDSKSLFEKLLENLSEEDLEEEYPQDVSPYDTDVAYMQAAEPADYELDTKPKKTVKKGKKLIIEIDGASSDDVKISDDQHSQKK